MGWTPLLRSHGTLADAGTFDLAPTRSSRMPARIVAAGRIFIDETSSADAALKSHDAGAVGILTYFVNEIRLGETRRRRIRWSRPSAPGGGDLTL